MYMKVAVTPRVVAAPPAPASGATSSTSGLGFVPQIVRRPGQPDTLQIPVPQLIFKLPNGLGQLRLRVRGVGQTNMSYTSGPCQYQLPGVPLIPNVPVCGPGGYQMTPQQIAAVLASQKLSGKEMGGAFTGGCPTDPNAVLPPGCFPGGGPNTQVQTPATPNTSAGLPISPVLAPGNVPPVGISTSPAAPAPVSSLPPASTTPTSSPAPGNPGGSTTVVSGGGGSPFSWLEDSVSLFGFGIPVWGLVAAGGVLVVVLMSGKGGK